MTKHFPAPTKEKVQNSLSSCFCYSFPAAKDRPPLLSPLRKIQSFVARQIKQPTCWIMLTGWLAGWLTGWLSEWNGMEWMQYSTLAGWNTDTMNIGKQPDGQAWLGPSVASCQHVVLDTDRKTVRIWGNN